jgi:hypothetical protein
MDAVQLDRQGFIDEVGISPEEFIRDDEAAEARLKYLLEHKDEFHRRFPGEHLAVTESSLVDHDRDLHAVLAQVDARGLPRGSVTFDYVPATDDPLMFPTSVVL